jgi:hypothetical protein
LARPKTVRPISGKALDPEKDFEEPVKKQADLPGMENRAIDELESAARRYAAIRDKRMALNDAEVKLKDLLLGLLKKHDKREYQRDGIRIWIKVEEETVKVKVDDDDQEGGDSAIRDKTDTRAADRTNGSATDGSGNEPDESGRPSEEVGNQAGQTQSESREPGDEGPAEF